MSENLIACHHKVTLDIAKRDVCTIEVVNRDTANILEVNVCENGKEVSLENATLVTITYSNDTVDEMQISEDFKTASVRINANCLKRGINFAKVCIYSGDNGLITAEMLIINCKQTVGSDNPAVPDPDMPKLKEMIEDAVAQAGGGAGLEPLVGTTQTITPSQVLAAIKEGRDIALQYTDSYYGAFVFSSFNANEKLGIVVSNSILPQWDGLTGTLIGFVDDAGWVFKATNTATKDDVGTAVNDALAAAKASGEFDGADGITPTIGNNGNWFLGDTDTGKPSRGEKGDKGDTGATGATGADGKSAYSYAQDGGYTGTEAEFAAKLAAEIPPHYTLPIASETTLGGVKPVAKTDEMTQSVGVDESGKLWTEPASGESGEEGATGGYVELGTLPYTVGNITELYLEPSEDCSLVISGVNDNNLITDLSSCLVSSSNAIIDGLLSEEYIGTHTVILTATAANLGNNFYDIFKVDGLTVGKEYTFSCNIDLSAVSGSAYARLVVVKSNNTEYGGVYGQTSGARESITFTAIDTYVRIKAYLWTGSSVNVGDAITFSDWLLCEGTSTDFGSAVTYTLTAGEKTRAVFEKGTEIPAVDGVTVTVFKYVEAVDGDLFVFLGDSIPCFDSNTGGIGAIPDYLREKCGGTWKNFCIGGTTMSAYRTSGNGYEYFTLDEWADSIASGDFSNQEQGVTDGATAGSTSYSISQKVTDAKALDWGFVKRIFFAYGTNDLAYGISEVGSADDSATKHGTMCAALKYAVQTILTAYPSVEIVVCGIIYRYADNPPVSAIIAANKTIKSTCENMGIPFVPLFDNMGVNEWNRTSFLYDGTHPNANGKERYTDTLIRILRL